MANLLAPPNLAPIEQGADVSWKPAGCHSGKLMAQLNLTTCTLLRAVTATMQAPPNLTPIEQGADASGSLEASWAALLAAGINDWGGLSPLTRDFVNPEKPWPHIAGLAAVTARAGFALLPR